MLKYFAKTVKLPKDLLEIIEFVQTLHPKAIQERAQWELERVKLSETLSEKEEQKVKGEEKEKEKEQPVQKVPKAKRFKIYLPSCLQKAIRAKFPEFSEYQLGKYCSESRRKLLLQK